MAKQARRPKSSLSNRLRESPAGRPASRPHGAPPPRSTYIQAVALYEQAIRTIQQHNFSKGADLLRHMMASFPEERELLERSRLYLTLCERQLQPPKAEPENTAERLYAATIALNAGAFEQAEAHLKRILQDEPGHDQALYMLAVAHAERDEVADAIRYLQQAIEANPENRALARVDPDLEDLRYEDAVMTLLDTPSFSRADERRVRRK